MCITLRRERGGGRRKYFTQPFILQAHAHAVLVFGVVQRHFFLFDDHLLKRMYGRVNMLHLRFKILIADDNIATSCRVAVRAQYCVFFCSIRSGRDTLHSTCNAETTKNSHRIYNVVEQIYSRRKLWLYKNN